MNYVHCRIKLSYCLFSSRQINRVCTYIKVSLYHLFLDIEPMIDNEYNPITDRATDSDLWLCCYLQVSTFLHSSINLSPIAATFTFRSIPSFILTESVFTQLSIQWKRFSANGSSPTRRSLTNILKQLVCSSVIIIILLKYFTQMTSSMQNAESNLKKTNNDRQTEISNF